jgi:AraC-like DNA-binding protein
MRHLLREGLAIDSLEINDEHLLQRWVDDLADPSAEMRQIVLLELEARLRRLALHFESAGAPAANASESGTVGSGLAAVGMLARYICDHYREDIAVEQIAGAAHLHPNYAMTLFRRHTGMTLNGYLVLQRVAHAQRLLTTTERSVSDIARDSGFGSPSRFYEAFRRQTGSAPLAFRRKLEA